jgi:hypothetical protein
LTIPRLQIEPIRAVGRPQTESHWQSVTPAFCSCIRTRVLPHAPSCARRLLPDVDCTPHPREVRTSRLSEGIEWRTQKRVRDQNRETEMALIVVNLSGLPPRMHQTDRGTSDQWSRKLGEVICSRTQLLKVFITASRASQGQVI